MAHNPEKPIECFQCRKLPGDVIAVADELCRLKERKMRGTVEYHLDGSGKIKSRKIIEMEVIGC